MKYPFLFVVCLSISYASCKTNSQEKNFSRYLDKIEVLNTPINFSSTNFSGSATYQDYKLDLFKKYKPDQAFELYGRVYKNQDFISLIFNTVGDANIPVLLTYRSDGTKIDSLTLFPNAMVSQSNTVCEIVTLYPDRSIKIVDTLDTCYMNSSEWKLKDRKIDSIKFYIDDSGSIIKK